jgi:hypothetical protein
MGAPITVKLREPISFGKETIEELAIKFNGRAMRDLKIPLTAEGGMIFEPYPLTVVGMKMAGHIANAEALADRLTDGQDMTEIAQVIFSFLGGSQTTGSTPSP